MIPAQRPAETTNPTSPAFYVLKGRRFKCLFPAKTHPPGDGARFSVEIPGGLVIAGKK